MRVGFGVHGASIQEFSLVGFLLDEVLFEFLGIGRELIARFGGRIHSFC